MALPRSRTAWMAQWLGRVSGAPVGHDLAIEADTIDGWLETIFRRVRGACETGAVEAWPILRRAIPECRIVAVLRDVQAVGAALIRAGVDDPPWDDLARRGAALRDLAAQPGVLAVDFDQLADPRVCAGVQEHCLSQPFDWPAWLAADGCNVQVDMTARLARLTQRRAAIMRLRAELIERLACPKPFVSIGAERWADVADACETMGGAHHAEASAGIEGPYRLNRAAMQQLADGGLLAAFIARVDGALAGYCLWQHEINLEAAAVPTMAQGPFYVAPAYKALQLGRRLLDVSRAAFAAAGYRVLRLHHTMHGRGARAGRLYEALGAIEYQREYVWTIGVNADA